MNQNAEMVPNRRISSTRNGQTTNINSDDNQSTVRYVGPVTSICQLNVEGMSRSKSEFLSKYLAERNICVFLAQETHTSSMEDLNARGEIDGYDLIVAEHSVHGIATYVKQGIFDVHVIESGTNNNIYTSVIRVGALSIAICLE